LANRFQAAIQRQLFSKNMFTRNESNGNDKSVHSAPNETGLLAQIDEEEEIL